MGQITITSMFYNVTNLLRHKPVSWYRFVEIVAFTILCVTQSCFTSQPCVLTNYYNTTSKLHFLNYTSFECNVILNNNP